MRARVADAHVVDVEPVVLLEVGPQLVGALPPDVRER
jgi:hypothetical protein